MPTERPARLEPLGLFDGARIAIVHEWIAARAGSEKVFEALAQLFPQADLYALTQSPGIRLAVGDRPVRTTFLDRIAILRERRHLTLPLMPSAWNRFSGQYDVVISSSHAFSRCFPPARSALHFSYVHTPARYLWTPQLDGRRPPLWAEPVAAWLRRVDRRTCETVEYFAANSTEVRDRIRTFYGRGANVIPPPVDLSRFKLPVLQGQRRHGLLCFGRWIEYKRFDLAIRAAHMAGEPLTVAGRGPSESQLRELAHDLGSDVKFVVSPSDDEVVQLMHTHRALLFPGREDFGIVPLEAAAAGLPVIAYAAGGARDTVRHGTTGWLVDSPHPEAWCDAVRRTQSHDFTPTDLEEHASFFSYQRFRMRVGNWLRAATTMSTPRAHRGPRGRSV